MAKRASLFATKATTQPKDHSEDIKQESTPPPVIMNKPQIRPPSRVGKRVLSVYLEPEAWKQLRMLSLNLETSAQALGEEAINLLFEKYRLNRIA